MTTQSGPDHDDSYLEDIPALNNIAPAIFVPTDQDFTKPSPPLSSDPISRLEDTIESLEWHAARVEENIVAMLLREAERVRRAGWAERVQYDLYHRPVKDPSRTIERELRLEEIILREEHGAVLRSLKRDKNNRFYEEAGSSSRESLPVHTPRPRGHWAPEYTDLDTLRRDKMFIAAVDDFRQSPRSAALTRVLNLVKWGWNDQLEAHRAAVRDEINTRRANLHRQMKENPFSLATTGPPVSAPLTSAPLHRNSADGDAMDIDS